MTVMRLPEVGSNGHECYCRRAPFVAATDTARRERYGVPIAVKPSTAVGLAKASSAPGADAAVRSRRAR
jgi:hypothetical protein